jgi:hypothetical protein
MKVTRRHLIKMLSYAIPALTSPQMRAFMRGKTGVVPGGVTATIEVLQSSDAAALPDLLVYGGTSSGVMTAYSAAREGLRVVLLEAGAHLGGMVTGGLSGTDLGHYSIIGGYVRDFYLKAASHYGVRDLDRMENWYSEPHMGEDLFRGMLKDAGVTVLYHQRLRELNGVELEGKRIVSISTEDGKRWTAKIFADCTYEGDLMAKAKVGYAWGRESASEYNEDLAGVRAKTPMNQFRWAVSAYDKHHRLLPEIDPGPLAAAGSGDKKVQAYNFRLILSNDPENRLPFPRPEGYDRSRFALLERYLNEYESHTGGRPGIKDLCNFVVIPNRKADFNNQNGFGSDYIGRNWKYPEAGYSEREAIWKDHLTYIQCFYYFITHDHKLPAGLRAETSEWGLSKDEFTDTDHWPHQLYVREARRMVGDYVMRQPDTVSERTKSDSIGMGSYNIDSHNTQRVAMPDGNVLNEGDVQFPVKPYEISYRSITPRRAEVENLLVTVCMSATHIAYCSIRMEPQYMILGQAAGTAASLAVNSRKAVQDISISDLQRKLREHGAVLHLDEEFRPAAT